MSKVFFINQLIAFYPDKNLLVNTSNGENKQILGGPSSRCLERLLEVAGSIVSHQLLYDTAWENSVNETSPNTLYQTILLVRKALKVVSESSDDFIITVPRKGFVFNEKIEVKVEDVIADSISAIPSIGSAKPIHTKNNNWLRLFFLYINAKPFLVFSVIMIAGMIFFLISGYKYFLFKQNDFSRDYTKYEQVGNCTLYLRQPVDIYKRKIDIFLAKHKEITTDCESYPFRYVSIVSKPVIFYVIACNNITGPARSCTSSYIRAE
ncbi:winged helix-turn-helix domain-containing protein [Klebsiella oxytoca]|uniref:winged helix-turn-helix domain-containing protein n=1 Tax=Klebsiella oxytoca TaxID=571 RepID=UPI001F1DDD70|nr:winged helix-turn-helix domain-containing protein [Klebsiella oxytoca]MCE5397555.1 winged helix-turn-helix domain-containing protein [Klebsiella oxytoca]